MKQLIWMAVLSLAAPMDTRAQGTTPNPVSTTLREVLDSYSKNLVATAEEMPADKYSYHPTSAQMTFGKSMEHVAEVNNFACSKVSGTPAPQGPKVTENDPKDKLVAGLKASMDFCKQAFSKLSDANLGESVTWFGGGKVTRFEAALEVTNNLQAGVSVYDPTGRSLESQKSELSRACPNESFFQGEDTAADYELQAFWADGWIGFLRRKDGAVITDFGLHKPDKDAARVSRQICRAIERDFPLWLNTQRERASIGKPVQTGATTSVEDSDPPRRYEVTEYRDGQIVGEALLDTKLGRLWRLTNIVDSKGKTVRSEFKEISVETLWESEDESSQKELEARSGADRVLLSREGLKLYRLKKLTRPAAIQHAEEQAEKEADREARLAR